MDYFHKIKSTVTGALPGNAVTRDFDIVRHVASAGPGLLWRIYDGVKKSTKEEASVFVFEKKQIERYSKRDKEYIVEVLKCGIQKITRLRHPKILSVLHPLEESRDSLAFATERVFASVANMLGYTDNMPSPPNADIADCKLYDVEIKYGLLQVTEGLTFLHNDAKIMHGNICPESIVIAKNGAWKLAGFDFSKNNSGTDQQPQYEFTEWLADYPHVAQPKLDYLAAEYVLTGTCSRASDMYSYGMLVHAVFNTGRPVFQCANEINAYKRYLKQLSGLSLGNLPGDLQQHVRLLLNTEPTIRPDADQTSKISFFEDVGVNTLQYLDTLIQRDNLQKSQFFKGLPHIIAKLPKRVCLQRMLPCMMGEFMNHSMIPFVLPSVIQISEQLSQAEYCQHVLPSLVPVFRIQHPIQIILICLQNMNLFLSKTPNSDIKTHILPLIYNALESDTPQIQEMCLTVVPTFADLVEYSTLKTHIFPRIKKLCLHTTMLTVRVNCLVCIGKLLEQMDKWFVLDEVLPSLCEVPSREPAVLMSILGIYQVAFTHPKLGITKELLSSKVLPFLIPLCVDSNLNLKQFNAFISVVKDMMSKMESEHRTKLEQLNSMQQEQRTIDFGPDPTRSGAVLVDDGQGNSMMDKFLHGFGLSTMMSKSTSVTKMAAGGVEADLAVRPGDSNGVTADGGLQHGAGVKPEAPKVANLSMEEKMRLAREQEQHQRLKAQSPLAPTATAGPQKQANGPKDLTASLAQSDFMNTNKSVFNAPATSGGAARNYGGGPPMRSGSVTATAGFGDTMGLAPSASGMGAMGAPGASMTGMGATMGGGSMSGAKPNFGPAPMTGFPSTYGQVNTGMGVGWTPNSGVGFQQSSNVNQWNSFGGIQTNIPQTTSMPSGFQSNKSMDFSAFDTLLSMPSNKPVPSLNQLASPPQWGSGVGQPSPSQPMNSSQFSPVKSQQVPKPTNDIADIFG